MPSIWRRTERRPRFWTTLPSAPGTQWWTKAASSRVAIRWIFWSVRSASWIGMLDSFSVIAAVLVTDLPGERIEQLVYGCVRPTHALGCRALHPAQRRERPEQRFAALCLGEGRPRGGGARGLAIRGLGAHERRRRGAEKLRTHH